MIKTVVLSVLGTYFNGIVLDHFIFDNSRKRRVCIITERKRSFVNLSSKTCTAVLRCTKPSVHITLKAQRDHYHRGQQRISEADEFYQSGKTPKPLLRSTTYPICSISQKILFCGQPFQLSAFCIRKPLAGREIQKKVSAGRTAPSCAAAHHRNTLVNDLRQIGIVERTINFYVLDIV